MSRTESPATQSFHTVCIVKDYVREQGLRSREVFVPLCLTSAPLGQIEVIA